MEGFRKEIRGVVGLRFALQMVERVKVGLVKPCTQQCELNSVIEWMWTDLVLCVLCRCSAVVKFPAGVGRSVSRGAAEGVGAAPGLRNSRNTEQ